ncbi:hypothetical protein F4821DRAFT_230640 [Hypoxylon rubiginosum]|uniref:Uncharacterized protein n=1 Tax=Hypoxylon rubiginosum TaxID=110542 RepID=A0ACC0DA71_9PEZI|nr:hypothetical protein F4821DRAFT_230640 [Hypoxylon rubiginosum]
MLDQGNNSISNSDSNSTVLSELTTSTRRYLGRCNDTACLADTKSDLREQPSAHPVRTPNNLHYACKTQPALRDSLQSIYVGKNDVAYRYMQGSVITFSIDYGSFPDFRSTLYAMYSLVEAADEWNRGGIGVIFRMVPTREPAVFQLVYSTDNEGRLNCLAESFFPNDTQGEEQPRLYVFWSAFLQLSFDHMVNTFCHELGHILGVRHGHARTDEREARTSSMEVGEYDPSSVMNYYDDLNQMRIRESDYNNVRRFYALDGEERYDNFTIRTIVPKEFDPLSHGWQLL